MINQYLAQLQQLLPQGAAWTREKDATITKLSSAFAGVLADSHIAADSIVNEADPRLVNQLTTDWERVLGLPHSCGALEQTLQERIAEIVRAWTARGGQSKAYFILLAAQLGFTITITEYKQMKVGDTVGNAVHGDDWKFAWSVNAPETTEHVFASGRSTAGEALGKWGNDLLECTINRFKPAHTIALFKYGGN